MNKARDNKWQFAAGVAMIISPFQLGIATTGLIVIGAMICFSAVMDCLFYED